MKRILFLLLMAACVAGIAVANNLDIGIEPEGLNDLVKQKGVFKTTLVRPSADFSRYTKLNPRKVILIVRDPGPPVTQKETGSLLGSRTRGGVMPEWEDIDKFKRIINETIATGLDCSAGLELVHDGGPETLMVRAAVTEVVFDASSKIRTADGEPSPVLSQGTIVFDLVDSETGVIQARMGERRKCKLPKSAGASSDIEGPWPATGNWTEIAVADLCEELRRLRGEDPSQ